MSDEQQLSEVLSEFARTLVTDFPIQGILDHLVKRIVDVLPISAAGVTLIAPDASPHYIAASNDSALCFERLQSETGEGPCLVAFRTGDPVATPDLRTEVRFPKFTPRALSEGLRAVFAFPLTNGLSRMGALDLYRTVPGSLDARSMSAAQTLADVASAYMYNAQARADLQESSDKARETALHDPLTGLPNRTLLLERLDHAVDRTRRSGMISAVLFADLDGFKQINDLFGHFAGDELLISISERLSTALRPGDTLARLSGDEFIILCEDLSSPAEADGIASRMVDAVAAPCVLSCAQVEVTASVGIAFSGNSDQCPEQVLQEADTAMYQAKRKGGGRFQTVDAREQHLAGQRANLERDLHGALQRGELRSHYQPIVDTATCRMVGVEALLRWVHPTRGLVPPVLAIPLAERSGLIGEIGHWILDQACRDRHDWMRQNQASDLTVAVNVSATQLISPGYISSVESVLESTDTDPHLVTLEVTESVFIQDSEQALLVLDELKRLGVTLALDDFGTGYSSLNYLRRFPIDIVKIDQGFVSDLGWKSVSYSIVASVVDLAHVLGMTVVAEGVETIEQLKDLESVGCDRCQGYYLARPMSDVALDTLIHRARPDRDVYLPALVAAGSL